MERSSFLDESRHKGLAEVSCGFMETVM